MSTIDQAFAARFAQKWVEAWNAHDLERILAHYDDDFALSSPVIVTLGGEPSGRLSGRAAVARDWAHYRGAHGRRVVQVCQFGANRKVVRAAAHYTS